MLRLAQGAKGIGTFEENVKAGRLPHETSIQHEGLFYDYYFETKNEEVKLFAPNYSLAVTKDPLNGCVHSFLTHKLYSRLEGDKEYYICIGMASGMDGKGFYKHGGRPPLNLVVVLDISGSMGSSFSGESKKKIEVAKESLLALLGKLTDKDKFGLVLFDDVADVIQPLQKLDSINLDALKRSIMDIHTRGGTTLNAGMSAATALFTNVLQEGATTHENRIIFLTDMIPNQRSADTSALFQTTKNNASNKLYTTFVGVGIDFNTSLVSLIGTIRACNYISVKSTRDFKKQLDEDFDYLVTPNVFDCSIHLEAEGWTPLRVFGSPGHEIPDDGRLMFMESSFPSAKEGDTMTKGGIVVVRLKKDPNNASSQLKLKTTYFDKSGKKYEEVEEFRIPEEAEKSVGDYFQSTSTRKAILLVRYVNFMKTYLREAKSAPKDRSMNTTTGIPIPSVEKKTDDTSKGMSLSKLDEQHKEVFKKFIDHFECEMEEIKDKMLDRELQQLLTIYNFGNP